MTPLDRAIDALTCDYITRNGTDVTTTLPLLERSVAQELHRISATLGGSRVLMAIAHSIDEALLALAEIKGDNKCRSSTMLADQITNPPDLNRGQT